MLIKWNSPLYGSTMHVASSLGAIPSFAVMHTEKQTFQCAILLSWEQGLGIRLAVLCGDFQTILFLLIVCRSLEKNENEAL